MEDYIKNRIYLAIGIVIIIIFFLWINSHYNGDLDTCNHSSEIKSHFYYNATCYNLDQSKYDCQRINYTKVNKYCNIRYPGGDWI